jgi:hypothetical protein
MGELLTRMGDGTLVETSEAELERDLEDGTRDAADNTLTLSSTGEREG